MAGGAEKPRRGSQSMVEQALEAVVEGVAATPEGNGGYSCRVAKERRRRRRRKKKNEEEKEKRGERRKRKRIK